MESGTKRCFLRAVLAVGALLMAGAAQAEGSRLSYASGKSDPVGQGTHRVIRSGVSAFGSRTAPGTAVYGGASVGNDYYFFGFRAPKGSRLVRGVYSNAVGMEGDRYKPGLEFSVNGRHCDQPRGSFKVLEAKLGPYDYVERVRVQFKQTCAGASSGSWGEVVIHNPPPPPLIKIHVTWQKKAYIEPWGAITLTGTYTCTKDGDAAIAARVAVRTSSGKVIKGGTQTRDVYEESCSTTPRTIVRELWPDTCAFQPGAARVSYDIYYTDRDYNVAFRSIRTADVTVVRR